MKTGWLVAAGLAAGLAGALPALPQEGGLPARPTGDTVEARFPPPAGYERVFTPTASFAAYLRRLPLKPPGSDVRLFDGRVKAAAGVRAAVVDLPIGDRDLHQCADAVIRLRADFLRSAGRPDDILFRFTNGFPASYARWRRGERIVIRGDEAFWTRAAPAEVDDRDYWLFLETVFTYAGTASLAAELESVPGDDPAVGDIFIRPGFPGHAVIVVDRAADPRTGRSVFLLAQSFMPAQEIHVLANPGDPGLSPWYAAGFGETLRTPEWIFGPKDLKRFKEE